MEEKKKESKDPVTEKPLIVYVDGSYVGPGKDEKEKEEEGGVGRGGAGVFTELEPEQKKGLGTTLLQVSMMVPVPLPRKLPHATTPLAYDPLRAEFYACVCALHRFREQARLLLKTDCLKAVVVLRNVKEMTMPPREYLTFPCKFLQRTFPRHFGFTGHDDFANARGGGSLADVAAETSWGPQDLARYVDVLDAWWEATRLWITTEETREKSRWVQVEWIPAHTKDPLELAAKLALAGTHIRSVGVDTAAHYHRGNDMADQLAARAREKTYWSTTIKDPSSGFAGFPLYPGGVHADTLFELTAGLPPPELWSRETRPLLRVSKYAKSGPLALEKPELPLYGTRVFCMWTPLQSASPSILQF